MVHLSTQFISSSHQLILWLNNFQRYLLHKNGYVYGIMDQDMLAATNYTNAFWTTAIFFSAINCDLSPLRATQKTLVIKAWLKSCDRKWLIMICGLLCRLPYLIVSLHYNIRSYDLCIPRHFTLFCHLKPSWSLLLRIALNLPLIFVAVGFCISNLQPSSF